MLVIKLWQQRMTNENQRLHVSFFCSPNKKKVSWLYPDCADVNLNDWHSRHLQKRTKMGEKSISSSLFFQTPQAFSVNGGFKQVQAV